MRNRYDQLQQQEQRITVSMIQGLKLLSLPVQAMSSYLTELAMSNPLLEIPEPPSVSLFEDAAGWRDPAFRRQEARRDDRSWEELSERRTSGEEGEFDPFFSCGVDFEDDDLAGSLRLQLSVSDLSPVEKAIGQDILGNLDESGFFIGNLQTICLLYCESLQTGEHVLETIQRFSPRGIAARDVYEALCLQVEDSFPWADLARTIIRQDLVMLCDGTPAACAVKYGVSEAAATAAFDYIRTLEPRPGNQDRRSLPVQYMQPDILVRRHGSELSVFVAGDTEVPLKLDDTYLRLMHQPGLTSEEKLYLRTCLNSARALIHSVEIRQQSLHRFALALVTLQGDFFREGPGALRPLTMQQMADEIGVNVSTVCRIVQDKYVSTPFGIFPMKYFFARALPGTEDGFVTADTAKRRIEELIQAEDSAAPLTDDDIAARLAQEGIRISRRTVSKYRQASGIPGCVKRKRKG